MRVTKLRIRNYEGKLETLDIKPGESVYFTPRSDDNSFDVMLLGEDANGAAVEKNWTGCFECSVAVTKQ